MRKALIVSILLLAGCSAFGPPATKDWSRGDTTPDEAAADLQSCRHAARAKLAMDQQIDQDMGADPTSQGGLANNLAQYDTEKRYNDMVRDCMLSAGYAPAGKATP